MTADVYERLRAHRFFRGLPDEYVERIASSGRLAEIGEDRVLAREGEIADTFYVLLDGRIAIETEVPGRRAPMIVQTVEGGDVVGWSWVDANPWLFDVRTLTPCTLIALDAREVTAALNSDTELGFKIMRRLTRVMTQRLQATRLRLLDVYGSTADDE